MHLGNVVCYMYERQEEKRLSSMEDSNYITSYDGHQGEILLTEVRYYNCEIEQNLRWSFADMDVEVEVEVEVGLLSYEIARYDRS